MNLVTPYLAETLLPPKPRPWAHGETSPIAIHPEGANYPKGPFLWRVSTATIVPPAVSEPPIEFSYLPDHDRITMLLEGAGMVLDHGPHGSKALSQPLESHRYSGGWRTTCTLTGGKVRDFNVMFDRRRARADLEVLRPGRSSLERDLSASFYLFYCLEGLVYIRLDSIHRYFRLGPGESLKLEGPPTPVTGRPIDRASFVEVTKGTGILLGVSGFLREP